MRSRRPAPTPPGTLEHLVTEHEVGCPSCGAILCIDQDDTVMHCRHCGRYLLLTHDGQAAQCRVEPQLSTDEAQASARAWLRARGHRATRIGQGRWLLVPYWRYRAKAFKWFSAHRAGGNPPTTAVNRETFRDLLVRPYDFTLPASHFDSGLEFIGAREEVLITRPASDAEWAELHPVTVGLDEARGTARQRVDRGTQPPGASIQAEKLTLLDERLELIQFPFFVVDYQFRETVRRVIMDGWSGAVTAHRDHTESESGRESVHDTGGRACGHDGNRHDGSSHDGSSRDGSSHDGSSHDGNSCNASSRNATRLGAIAFLPSRCPVCLTEMTPARQDRVHVCSGCRRAWEISGTAIREIPQRLVDNGIPLPADAETEDERLLPFWAIRAVASGWRTSAAQASGGEQMLYVPAFDGRHIERMCQLGIHLSRAHPEFKPHADWVSGLSGCTIGRADAARMAWVMLGAMASPDASSFARFIERGEVDIEDARLLWIPFRAAGLYLREPLTGALVREVSTRPWELPDELAA